MTPLASDTSLTTLRNVAAFLSPEWLEELRAAATRSARLPDDLAEVSATFQQVVREAPGGEVAYAIRIAGGHVEVEPGPPDAPDLTFTTDYVTAVAMNQGRLTAQEALTSGRLRVRGNLDVLAADARALGAVDDLFADVRARTTYHLGPYPAGDDKARGPTNAARRTR